ncbi:4Fe-4S binding protein [bacterium 210820-DFI.6.37]|nr:4Fe-4S binding protein [bacterium 210820-DFI.6.37]
MKIKKKDRNRLVRAVIQIAFFFLAPGLFSAAFAGVRYLAGQIGGLELIEPTAFVKVLLILLAYTVVFGRFFCGYACAFGTLGDAVYEASAFLQRKLRKKKKPFKLPEPALRKLQYIKYILLVGILALCFLGYYSKVSKADPWELFASFIAGNFSLKGFLWAGIALGIILIGMCLVERFFCQFLCPMGAVFALMPTIPASVLVKDKENCIKGCSLCKRTCPMELSLEDPSGECIQCGSCTDACPKGNIGKGIKNRKGNEIAAVVIKAAILFGVCYPWI